MVIKTVVILWLALLLVFPLAGCGQYQVQVHAETMKPNPEKHLVPLTLGEASLLSKKYTRHYSWNFNDIEWHWVLRIPESSYDYFRGTPRPDTRDYSVYASHPLDDKCLNKLAVEFNRIAEKFGFSDHERVAFVASFVQSLTYTVDSETTAFQEYPRYPVETLVDMGGDCEDTSILLAALFDAMEFDVALVYFPRTTKKGAHYGVGLAFDDAYGTHWEQNGKKYYYLESNRKGWNIGAISVIRANVDPTIYEVKPIPFLVHEWVIVEQQTVAVLEVTVVNAGTAVAGSIRLQVIAYDGNDIFMSGGPTIYSSSMSPEFKLLPGESVTIELQLTTESLGPSPLSFVVTCNY